jgi:hypothetical protein
MRTKEFILIFFIFIIGLILYLYQKSQGIPLHLIVEVNNKEIMKIDLKNIKEKKFFSIDGILGKSYFEYDPKNGVRMISSPCPDKYCIKQGWIKKIGSSIICLPNRVVLILEK